jgi:hypothetical protein
MSDENPWEQPTPDEARMETIGIFVGAAALVTGGVSLLLLALWILN